MAKNSVHEMVFKVYELNYEKKSNKEKIRKFINRKLERFYPGQAWEELMLIEKNLFIYEYIMDEMFDRYIEQSKHRRLKAKINETREKEMFLVVNKIVRHNQWFEKLEYNESDTDTEKHMAYENFKRIVNNYFSSNYNLHDLYDRDVQAYIPTFDEWEKINKRLLKEYGKTYRPYDLVKEIENSFYDGNSEYAVYASQQEIDHIVIQVLLKILEDKFNLAIDDKGIRDCLNITKSKAYDDGSAYNDLYPYATEDDDLLKDVDISEMNPEERKELEKQRERLKAEIKFNKLYEAAKLRLANFDFLKEIEKVN